jgi:hypothetical protein
MHHDAALDGDYFFTQLDEYYEDQQLPDRQSSTMKSKLSEN